MHKKGLTSFLTLGGFLVMTVTGIILYIVPQGRVAYWTHWSFLGLSKTDWGNIHTVSCLLWIVAGGFHLYFNWSILTHYIYNKAQGGWRLKKELGLASIITLAVVLTALYEIPPVSYIIDAGSRIKDAWVKTPDYEPPFGHAELLSLKGFSRKMNMNPDEALAELKKQGVKISSTAETLEEIALANQTSPMLIYAKIKSLEKPMEAPDVQVYTPDLVEEQFAGSGIGRKQFSEIIKELNLNVQQVQGRLKKKGLQIADDESIKQAANRYKVTPVDLLKAVLVDDYTLPAQ